MSKLLVVVDYQKDFVDGALGYAGAEKLEGPLYDRVRSALAAGWKVIFTRDTHGPDYLDTQEGKHLPVPHCIRGTEGWEIIPQLRPDTVGCTIVDKPTFGSRALGEELVRLNETEPVRKITLIGVCTDICVLSNALLAKAFLPEAEIVVEANCCAGVTPEAHRTALAALGPCQITVKED